MMLGRGRAVRCACSVRSRWKSSLRRSRRRINPCCAAWDGTSIRTYSGNRGELFPLGSYGHTGFTGTSLWIDPTTQTFVILLNEQRASPPAAGHHVPARAGGDHRGRRGRAEHAGWRSLDTTKPCPESAGWSRGTGRCRPDSTCWPRRISRRSWASESGSSPTTPAWICAGRRSVDLMLQAGVNVTAILSPEHGATGEIDGATPPCRRIRRPASRFGACMRRRPMRPSPEMLQDLDVLVFDIQDVGARFYTYISTLGCHGGSGGHGIAFYVLDRPNPIDGVGGGPMLEEELVSVRGIFSAAVAPRHDGGRAGAHVQRGEQIGADSRHRDEGLAARRLVRLYGPEVDQPFAEPAEPEAALLIPAWRCSSAPGLFGRTRHRHAVRTNRSGVDERPRTGGAFQTEVCAGGAVLFDAISAWLVACWPAWLWRACGLWSRTGKRSARNGWGWRAPGRCCAFTQGMISLDLNRRLIGNEVTIQALAAGEDPRQIEQVNEDNIESVLSLRAKYLLYRQR